MRLPLIFLLLFLSGCSGNSAVESLFSPNPSLQNNPSENNNQNTGKNNQNQTPVTKVSLPEDYPKDIPIYQSSELKTIAPNSSTWSSNDPLNLITSYYRQQLVVNQWKITTDKDDLIVASKNERILNISFLVENNQTKFVINQEEETKIVPINNNNSADIPTLEKLVKLEIIENNPNLNPYQIITRREYVRWLVKANNIVYANVNSKLIRLANPNSQPLFKDVSNNDRDFVFIQGLAEAGIIPSSLTNNKEAIVFNPDKPLTRQDLIPWKVALDYRQQLPNTTIDNLQQTWAFKDINQTSPQIWSELYIDWQNGENSNVRKAFGYVTLFQPQKTVTYEEASLILTSFGYQKDIVFLK